MSNNLNQGASEAELLPCPFCGSVPDLSFRVYDTASYKTWGVSCCVEMEGDTDRQATILMWNRRTPAATTGELPSVKTWQDRYFVDGTGPGDQDMMMRCMEDEIADLRAHLAAPASAQPAELTNAEFLAKRLGRVAKLAGVPMPDGTYEQIAEVAGTILGQIAYALERGAQPDQRESAAVPACRNQGGICACRSGGSFGGCAMERAASPAAQPAKDEQMTLYTCVGKGGFYRLLGTATGAGTSRGLEDVRVYMEADNLLALYYRTIIDFDARMQAVQVQDSANNGADEQKGGAA